MSASEREATRLYVNRAKYLREFWCSRKSGDYHRGLAQTGDHLGLCNRTIKDYWLRGVWGGYIEINGDGWKWIANRSTAETKVKPSPKETANLDFESPTPFTDHVKREKHEELRQKLRERKKQDMEA